MPSYGRSPRSAPGRASHSTDLPVESFTFALESISKSKAVAPHTAAPSAEDSQLPAFLSPIHSFTN